MDAAERLRIDDHPDTRLGPTDLLIIGVPKFQSSSSGEFALTCTITSGFIVLTFSSAVALPTLLTLAAADPA